MCTLALTGCLRPSFGLDGGDATTTTGQSGAGGGSGGGGATTTGQSGAGGGSGGDGMVDIPGGSYVLGDAGTPATVADFELDATEVTVDAFVQCVSGGMCSTPKTGGACNWGVSDRGNHPVNCVDWNQATAYCGWAGKRLPTEAEWEWAARGGEAGSVYPWGNGEPGARACWNGEGNDVGAAMRQSTCAVGGYPSGDAPGGIHDLAGNVWEWTSTAYDSSARVSRGGGWASDNPSVLRAAGRGRDGPSNRDIDLGFRCAR
jgi:formylglycine-generating enzyme required for sulfatase activity